MVAMYRMVVGMVVGMVVIPELMVWGRGFVPHMSDQ
jgi:hypothetical protein